MARDEVANLAGRREELEGFELQDHASCQCGPVALNAARCLQPIGTGRRELQLDNSERQDLHGLGVELNDSSTLVRHGEQGARNIVLVWSSRRQNAESLDGAGI